MSSACRDRRSTAVSRSDHPIEIAILVARIVLNGLFAMSEISLVTARKARMNQARLLAALNALGKEPDLGKRWRHAIHPNRELEVVKANSRPATAATTRWVIS